MIRYNKISCLHCLNLTIANTSSQGHFVTCQYTLGFLRLCTIENLGWIICFEGGLSCTCRMFSSIPGFCPLDASGIACTGCGHQKCLHTLPNVCLLGRKSPHLRITAVPSTESLLSDSRFTS